MSALDGPKLLELGVNLVEIGPPLAAIDPTPVEFESTLAGAEPSLAEFGPRVGRNRSRFAKFDRSPQVYLQLFRRVAGDQPEARREGRHRALKVALQARSWT